MAFNLMPTRLVTLF